MGDQLAWILVANWAVALAKLGFGVWAHFAAMTADGLHSFIDGSSNIVGDINPRRFEPRR